MSAMVMLGFVLAFFLWMVSVVSGTLTHTMLDGDCPGPSTLYVRGSVQVALRRNPHQYPESSTVRCRLLFRAQQKRYRLLLTWKYLIIHPDNMLRVLDNLDPQKAYEDLKPFSKPYLSQGNQLEVSYDGQPHLDTFRLIVTEVLVSSECYDSQYGCEEVVTPFCIDKTLLCNSEDNCGTASDESHNVCIVNIHETHTSPTTTSTIPLSLMGAIGGVICTVIIIIFVCLIVHVKKHLQCWTSTGRSRNTQPTTTQQSNTPAIDHQIHHPRSREPNEYVPLPTTQVTSNGQTTTTQHLYAQPTNPNPNPDYMNSGPRHLPDLFQLADMSEMLTIHTSGYPRTSPISNPQPEVSISDLGYMDISTLTLESPDDHMGGSTENGHLVERKPSLPPRRTLPAIENRQRSSRGRYLNLEARQNRTDTSRLLDSRAAHR